MKVKHITEIMFDLFSEYEEYQDIKNALRCMNSFGNVSDAEYDYALEHWDELLEKWGKEPI